jgi:spore maturation protein CgeB
MESEFKHGEHIFYYESADQLADLIVSLKNNDALRKRVAAAGSALVKGKHTYQHRARMMLEYCRASAAPGLLPVAKDNRPLTTENGPLTTAHAPQTKL